MRLVLIAFALLAGPALAAGPASPVVVELFTSEGCSSCPPAEALLREMALHRPDVLPLAYHITYWNNLGWPDRYALTEATERQRDYARRLPSGIVYTPQMVVDGTDDLVGSNRMAADAAIAGALAWQATQPNVALGVSQRQDQAVVQVGAGQGEGRLLLVGFDPEHQTAVLRGENAGQTLIEANVVRSIAELGPWSGTALERQAPLGAGERHAVLLQGKDGRFIAAAVLPASAP